MQKTLQPVGSGQSGTCIEGIGKGLAISPVKGVYGLVELGQVVRGDLTAIGFGQCGEDLFVNPGIHIGIFLCQPLQLVRDALRVGIEVEVQNGECLLYQLRTVEKRFHEIGLRSGGFVSCLVSQFQLAEEVQ